MTTRKLPFDEQQIRDVITQFPTPFHIYDESGIRSTARQLNRVFSWAPGFTNYFAVKALPNPAILKILKEERMSVDCSSLAELILAEQAGFNGEQIILSSNDTPVETFIKAYQLGAIINLDDITHFDSLQAAIGALPDILCFRFNPGGARTGSAIIGTPAESKFGMTKDQIFEAYEIARKAGVTRFGLHTMIASNVLDPEYFIETARTMFELADELRGQGIELEFINLGGGYGIPYSPDQTGLDIEEMSMVIHALYDKLFGAITTKPKLYMEQGRYITGTHGYLVSKIIHRKSTYREYIGLDANMANLMRPGMYGAYHHITVLGKENSDTSNLYDVTGNLCENNDKFAIQRPLPETDIGDIVVIHDTGAHGHAMGFNYNGSLRSSELLLKSGGNVELIRRAEALEDYFATLTF